LIVWNDCRVVQNTASELEASMPAALATAIAIDPSPRSPAASSPSSAIETPAPASSSESLGAPTTANTEAAGASIISIARPVASTSSTTDASSDPPNQPSSVPGNASSTNTIGAAIVIDQRVAADPSSRSRLRSARASAASGATI
jgi:hypothetical protein